MKKFLLTLALASIAAGAHAYWLPTPVITSETKENGKVTITWDYDVKHPDARHSHFVVTVFKMHKATADENFRLAGTDFDAIQSSGTMAKSEERGMIWDDMPYAPGWWARMPKYMNKALGIDVIQYYPGSNYPDPFGGAYMVSPDYDLSKVTDKTLYVSAEIGNEASSVTGGFAVWAYNTNFYDPTNADYKPVYNLDRHYDDLSSSSWKSVDETLTFPKAEDFRDPDQIEEINGIHHDRVRVMFYGYGKSTYWINKFEVNVHLKAGDCVDYAASQVRVDAETYSYTIDTTGDTADDYIYAYEVRALNEEFDDYRNLDYIRAINFPYTSAKNIIDQNAGVEDVAIGEGAVNISAANGQITVTGAQEMQVFNIAGVCVYSGSTANPVTVGSGMFIVKAAGKTAKVVL